MRAGSNDEFSDCDLHDNENDDNDDITDLLTSTQPQQGGSGASSPPSTTPTPTQWSSVLSSVSISDFTSVGPTVQSPSNPPKSLSSCLPHLSQTPSSNKLTCTLNRSWEMKSIQQMSSRLTWDSASCRSTGFLI